MAHYRDVVTPLEDVVTHWEDVVARGSFGDVMGR